LSADNYRQMHLFKSRERNLVHDVTAVAYRRVLMFSTDRACSLLIEALSETREKDPFKLIGYVILPDHFHLLANPLKLDISKIVGKLKGRGASRILRWLRDEQETETLRKLKIPKPLKSGQTHAVWLKGFSAIDLWSHKFIRQKLHYVHMNPVRAGLCDHAAKWRWSSYHAYLPHEAGSVPIEVDQRWWWSVEEFEAAADKCAF
jgi:REP element-mobilizing transposase RayT